MAWLCVCVRREGEESHKQHTLTFECTFHTQTKMIMLCTFQLWVICCGNSCGIPYTYEYFVCWIYRLPQLKFPFPSHEEPKTMDKMWLFWNKNPTKLWQLNCAMQYYVSQFQIVYTRILSLPPAPTIPAKCFNFPDYLLNALYTHTHTCPFILAYTQMLSNSFCWVDEVCFVTAVIPPNNCVKQKRTICNASHRKIAIQFTLPIHRIHALCRNSHRRHASPYIFRLIRHVMLEPLVNSNLIKLAFSKSDEYNCVHKYCRFMFMHVRNLKCHYPCHYFIQLSMCF